MKNNSLFALLLVAFCCPLRAQQPFSPGIRHQLIFSAGKMLDGNGKVYFTAAYEYELGRRFSVDLKCGVDAGSASSSFLDYYESVTAIKPLINDNPSGALVKFRVNPEQGTLVTLSPRLQVNLRQNTANRIWVAAGPVGAFVRRTIVGAVFSRPNPVNGQEALTTITELKLQRYLSWGLNIELAYHLKINRALFLAANAGGTYLDAYDNIHDVRYYATLGIGLNLGGYSKNIQ